MVKEMFRLTRIWFIKISCALALLLLLPLGAWGYTTLISTTFDDRTFDTKAIQVYSGSNYCIGASCPWSTTERYGETGYSLVGDHAQSGYSVLLATTNDPSIYMNQGVYIRYYVYYPSSYQFPAECGSSYSNLKLFKFAGSSSDIELIWFYNAGPVDQYQYLALQADPGHAALQGYRIANPSSYLVKDKWNKIEIYLKVVGANSQIKVQINDSVCVNVSGANITASPYDSAKQMASIRATGGGSCMPSSGHGTWYIDQLTVVYNTDSAILDNEPPEPGSSNIAPLPPKAVRIVQ
jgi:hypothetical protein